jgi:homoserine O-acetyltransferase
MVHSQYRLLTEKLEIKHLHAVIGMSMGGMQAFQWGVLYPAFFNKLVAIVPSPQPTSQDLLTLTALSQSIENAKSWNDGNYKVGTPFDTTRTLLALFVYSPDYRIENTQRENFKSFLSETDRELIKDFEMVDLYRQIQAVVSFDLIENQSMAEFATKIRTPMLIIVSQQDHMVNPKPATEFATLAKKQLLTLKGNCGHMAPICEMDKVSPVIADFLR